MEPLWATCDRIAVRNTRGLPTTQPFTTRSCPTIAIVIVRRGVTPAAAGVCVGLLISLVGGRFVSSFVFGVEAWDPATLGSVAFILLAVSVAASYAPAWQASRVNPMEALHGP